MATLSTGPFRSADLIQFRFIRVGSPFRDKQQTGTDFANRTQQLAVESQDGWLRQQNHEQTLC
jgi:hypothetical protein